MINLLRTLIISLVISIISLVSVDDNKSSAPVRLEKKQSQDVNLTTEKIEIVVVFLFVVIMMLSIFFLVTSCTDSGLVYNQLNNTI